MIIEVARLSAGGTLTDRYVLSTSFLCMGYCGKHTLTLSPIETVYDDGTFDTTGAALCRSCLPHLYSMRSYVRDSWPLLCPSDMADLWLRVEIEQRAQRAREEARRMAAPREATIESVEAALRAAQIAAAGQRGELRGKVA